MRVKLVLLLMCLAASLSMPVWANEELSSRLKAIESKQDEILNRLAELKQEIEIVKVRTTR